MSVVKIKAALELVQEDIRHQSLLLQHMREAVMQGSSDAEETYCGH